MRINGIISDSIVDGPGLRTTIFFQGCKRHCPGCHNPQTWECNTGLEITSQELLEAIREKGNQDITFSGGEPLLQAEEILELIPPLRQDGRNIWLWTGSRIEDVFAKKDYADCNSAAAGILLSEVDYIVDGPFDISKRDITLKWRGSSNQRIIKVNYPGVEKNKIYSILDHNLTFNDVTEEEEKR